MAANELEWFPFYVNDWLLSRSVRRMSHEQKGVYFDLLCIAWRDGGIPIDLDEVAVDLGMAADRLGAIWPRIGAMFVPHATNALLLVNPRMEDIRSEQNAKREAQAEKGRRSGESRRLAALNRGSTTVQPNSDPASAIETAIPAATAATAIAPSRTQAMVDLLPETHRTTEVYDAVRAFFRMRSENKFTTWKESTMATNAKQFATFPPDVLVAALNHSTTNQYQGVFPKEFMPGGKHGPRLHLQSGGRQGPSSIADRKAQLAAERATKEGLKDAA